MICIVCVLIVSAAFSERNPWTCPDCGKTENKGNYCGKCGHPAPDMASPTPRMTATPAVSTPTPKKTATPAPKRVFELNSNIVSDKGHVTVTWTDSENRKPYTVCYRYEDSSVSQPLYSIGKNVTAQSYTLDCLIPGKTYTITIIDADNQRASRSYTLPKPDEFEDGKLKASSIKVGIEGRYKGVSDKYSQAKRVSVLKASDIVSNRGTYDYGFRYNISYPQLAHSRQYLTQIAVYAPNGYMESELVQEHEYGSQYAGYHWYILGTQTFDAVYKNTGTIPAGKWTVELYWDGMFVNRSTFTVK